MAPYILHVPLGGGRAIRNTRKDDRQGTKIRKADNEVWSGWSGRKGKGRRKEVGK
jgi:hypothetical protein